MKLHKLRLCNLNSLQGVWEINFASEALLSEGIFLITGPTGAGKSTILDAICLALYGRTPRLGRISKASNEIISRGAGECFAQLSFSAADGKLYNVRWRQRRARGGAEGKLQEPERELSLEETGEILAAKINEVEEQIPQISGLEYEQFLRSILLAQGDFAAFMESSSNERAEILEKITGTAIYREVSKLCYQRCKQEQHELEIQEKQQKVLLPLPDEQRRELEEAAEAAQGQLQQMDERQKHLYKALQHYKSLEQSWQEQQRLQQNIATLPDHKNDRERLAQDTEAQKLEPLHQKWQEMLEQLKSKKDSIQKQNTEQSERSEQVRKLKIKLSEAEAQWQSVQKIHKHFLKEREQLKELEWNERENGKTLSQRKEQMAECRKQLAKTEAAVGQLQAQLQEKGEAIAELQRSLNTSCLSPNIQNVKSVQDTELESLRYRARQLSELHIPAQEWRKQYERLHTAEIEAEIAAKIAEGKAALEQLKNFDLPTLELQPLPSILQLAASQAEAEIEAEQREDILNCAIESCQLLISPLARYLLEYQQYSHSLRQSQESDSEVQQQEKELAKVQEDLKKQEQELKRQERYCETLRKNLELHQHLLLFERERKRLQHGETCPLCGASEHNFEQAPAPPKESQATQDELEKQEQILLELHNAVQGDQNEATKLANQLASSKEQAKKQHAEALHLQGELGEQSQLLQNILQKYQAAGFTAQALLPQLWQVLQAQAQAEQSQTNVQAQTLQAEFDDCQKQLKTFQNAEDQAFETHQRRCEQLQEEHNAQIQKQEKRLADLQTQQHQAELQAKEWQSFCTKIREDFLRLYSPYVQYLQEIQSQKNTGDIENISPEEQELLQAVEQASSIELLLQIAESKTLQAMLQKRSTDLQQALSDWQTQQEMQSQIPLLEERSKSAAQQQQAEQQQIAELAQQIAESEAEAAALQDAWQKKIAHLLKGFEELKESAGASAAISATHFVSSKSGTEQIEQSIEQQLQDSEAHKEKRKTQSSELEKQFEVIQELLANAQKECEALQKNCDKALQEWQEALSDSAFFATAENFLAAKLPAQQRSNIEEQIRDTEQKQNQWQARIRELEQQITEGFAQAQNLDRSLTLATPKIEDQTEQVKNQAEQALRDAEQQLQESYKGLKKEDAEAAQDLELALQRIQALVGEELEETQNRGNAIREELGAQKQSLTSDDALRQKLEQNAAQLQQKRQELKHWELLNELIGSAQGDKYNRFAQQLSFEQLVYHANFYLERVSDRYLLQSLPEHPLEFFVTDLYQLESQNLRPSSNLSGGEKFLISLSLSLALSKISANKVPVQSLFLDEGFGTLDEEALHSTLEVLASLSNDGKLIGLISHISTLRERIMCQIQLESIGEGRSLIRSSGDIVHKIQENQEIPGIKESKGSKEKLGSSETSSPKSKQKKSKKNEAAERIQAEQTQAEKNPAEQAEPNKASNPSKAKQQTELF